MKSDFLKQLDTEITGLIESLGPLVVMVGDETVRPRSGAVIEPEHIVTIARWAEDGETVTVRTGDGATHPARVMGFHSSTGIALLHAPDITPGHPLSAPSADVRVGRGTLTVAFPSPEGIEARLGIIRCVGNGYIQTDSAAFPGFAGSLVTDWQGCPIGISGSSGRGNDDYVYPMADVLAIAEDLRTHGSPKSGYLGIRTESVETSRERRGELGETSLLIVGIEDESPAARAGLMVGDLIISVNGSKTPDHESLITALSTLSPEGEITVELLRGGTYTKISVDPERRSGGFRHGHRGGRRRRP